MRNQEKSKTENSGFTDTMGAGMVFRNCGSFDLDDPESDNGPAAVHIVGTVPN